MASMKSLTFGVAALFVLLSYACDSTTAPTVCRTVDTLWADAARRIPLAIVEVVADCRLKVRVG